LISGIFAKHTPKMNCNEMAGDRLTICEQELLWAFARLVSVSSNFLFFSKVKFVRRASASGASFYFGHSGTILPLYVALGLFRDHQPLTAETDDDELDPVFSSPSSVSEFIDDERQFRMSRIDPMSANIAFILYDCQPVCSGICRCKGKGLPEL